MNPPRNQSTEALESALRAAHENERRWMEVCPGFSSDSEQTEQWTKLRRREAERIETLLANVPEPSSLPTFIRENDSKLKTEDIAASTPTGALTYNHAQETNCFRPGASPAMLCQRTCR
jgi:hypothetical protein